MYMSKNAVMAWMSRDIHEKFVKLFSTVVLKIMSLDIWKIMKSSRICIHFVLTYEVKYVLISN